MKVSIDRLASLVFDQGYRFGWEQGRNMEMAFPEGKTEREQHRDLIAEGDKLAAEVKELRGEIAADNQRLRDAEERVWPGQTHGCDAPEWMADEILWLRAEVDRLRHSPNAPEWMADEILALQEQLATWSESGELMKAEIETLRTQLADAKREASEEFAERQVLQAEASDDNAELVRLRAQLVEAEKDRDMWRSIVDDKKVVATLEQQITSLQKFVSAMRGQLTEPYADQRIIAEELAELDDAMQAGGGE